MRTRLAVIGLTFALIAMTLFLLNDEFELAVIPTVIAVLLFIQLMES